VELGSQGVRIRRGPPRPELIVLLGLIAVEVVLLALLPYLATTDGPIHIGSGGSIRDYVLDAEGIQRTFLEISWFPVPNLLTELSLAALLAIVDPGTAEKAVILAYVVGLPLGLYYALGGLQRTDRWLALVAIPLTFNASLHFGFLGFSLALVPCLVAIGYLLRHRGLATRRSLFTYAVLMAIVYLTHLVPFVEAVLASGCIVLEHGWRESNGGARLRRLVGTAGRWSLAVAPTVLLAAWFFLAGGTEGSDYRRAFLTLLLGLPSLAWPIVSYDRLEAGFTVLVGAALGLATLLAIVARWQGDRSRRREDWALLFTLLSTAAYFLAPEALGSGGVVSQRLALFPVIGLVLWLAAQPIRRWAHRTVAVASIVAAVGLLALRAPSYISTSAAVADYVTLTPCIAPRSTLVQANLWWFPSGPLGRISPLIHDTGRLSAATHGHDLGSITSAVPLFPLQNRPATDPFRYLVTRQNGEYEIPPGIDPLGYEAATGEVVDYVVLFGRDAASPETLASPDWEVLDRQLTDGYRRVAVSPTGRVELLERSLPATAAAGDAQRAGPGSACATTVGVVAP
jgi:hypothetical protein